MHDYEKYASFSWQLKNSFLPLNYKEYDFVDETDTNQFLRKFAIIIYVLFAAMYLLLIAKSSSAINNGSVISEEDGYKYSISNGHLKISKPVFVDDLSQGIYVNITDQVEFFDVDKMYDFFEKGYKSVLLISRTNRVKMAADSQTYSYVVNYFDDMQSTSEAGRNNIVPGINATTIVVLAVTAVGFYYGYPFFIRLSALILAVITGLFCSLLRLGTDKGHLRVICAYANVPSQLLSFLGAIVVILFTKVSSANFIEAVKGNPAYGAIGIITTLLPFVFVMIAAVAEKNK